MASYVVDLTHFLDDDGFLAPGAPGRHARYYTRITAAASLHPVEETVATALHCRRRPGRRPCPGRIDLIRHEDGTIEWACSDCTDNGFIRGWEGTLWDWRPAAGRVAPREPIDLLLSEDEFAEIGSIAALGPDGQMLVDGAMRVGGGVRMHGDRGAFEDLLGDIGAEARAVRGARRRTLDLIRDRMAAILGRHG